MVSPDFMYCMDKWFGECLAVTLCTAWINGLVQVSRDYMYCMDKWFVVWLAVTLCTAWINGLVYG